MSVDRQSHKRKVRDKVVVSQLTSVFRWNRLMLANTVFALLLVYYFLYDQTASTTRAAMWMIGMQAITLCRFMLGRAYLSRDRIAQEAAPWRFGFVALTGLAGAGWGLLGTVLYPATEIHSQVTAAMILLAVSGTGLFSLYPVPMAYFAFSMPMLLPFIVMRFMGEAPADMYAGFTGSFFLLVALLTARRSAKHHFRWLVSRYRLRIVSREREQALKLAEESSRAKSEFLANMSHEIRTPMNGVLGMSDLLGKTKLDNTQSRYVRGLRSSGEQLLSLLNDVLDFSKIEAGKMLIERVPYSVMEIASMSTEMFLAQAQAKGIEISVECENAIPTLVGDPVRLGQVLSNLISNSVKFTERGYVRLSVGWAWETEGRGTLTLTVRDTGIGIPKDKHAAIFDSFAQADQSTTRKFGGTGLGLAIAGHLVALMNGKISVKSEPSLGAVFTVTLPVEYLPTDKLQPLQPSSAIAEKRPLRGTVLLVEDNDVNELVSVMTLRGLGLGVVTAHNGAEAIAAYETKKPDAVLMDCHMPGMDGFEATRAIRRIEGGRTHVPIVACTANVTSGFRDRCIEVGMDDYVSKPFRENTLYAVLAKHLLDTEEMIDGSLGAALSGRPNGSPIWQANAVDLPVFDASRLMKAVAHAGKDSSAMLEKLVPLFLNQLARFSTSYEQHIEAADIAGLASIAHTLKSSSNHVGLVRLSREMDAMETLCAEAAPSEVLAAARRLLPLLGLSRGALEGWQREHHTN